MSTAATVLTRRQQAVYDHLLQRHREGRPPPSLDELCEALGVRSRGSMHKHVQALVEAGILEPMAGKQRGVRLKAPEWRDPVQLPLLGVIAAGRPIEAVELPEDMAVPPHLTSNGPCYVLQVRGDSMVEDGILDGDWVIVEQREQARDGEIVVALVDGSEATLKRIVQRPGEVLLVPSNSGMHSMSFPPGRVRIQGVVIGQMRSYR
jgi:repressor LexA